MALHTWSQGQPSTGASKNSQVSSELVKAAIADTVFALHVDTEPFKKGVGQSVTIERMSSLAEPTSWALSELDRLPETAPVFSAKLMILTEQGNSIPFSLLAEEFSPFDLPMALQDALKDDIKLFMDSFLCAAFKRTLYKYTPTGAASAQTAVNGTFPTTAGSQMNVYHVERLRSILYTTLKAKPVDGRNYVGIFHADALLGIRRDPDWQMWHDELTPENKFNAEVGTLEQIRFVESNHGGTAIGSNGLSGGSTLGEGVVFGKGAVRMSIGRKPDIRPGQPDDYGRIKGFAWHCTIAAEPVWADESANSGEGNILHIGGSSL